MTVHAFIDAIRDKIQNHYGTQLVEILQTEQSIGPADWMSLENNGDPEGELNF